MSAKKKPRKKKPPPRLLRYGDRGDDVAELQIRLRVKVTKVFDNRTLKAVRKFQAENNMEVNGLVGPFTRERLDR